MNALFDQDAMRRRIERELIDGYDEEIEMEMEDRLVADPLGRLDPASGETHEAPPRASSTSASCSGCRASSSSCRTGSRTRARRS